MRKWLVEKRKEKGFSGTEVAKRAGISQAEYSRIESGKRSPRLKAAKLIAFMLDFDWTRWYEDEKAG